jgi:hypothetical protein
VSECYFPEKNAFFKWMMTDPNPQIDAMQEFRDSIANPLTRRNYENRVVVFLSSIDVGTGTLQEKATRFVEKARKDAAWATREIGAYMNYQKMRADKNQISASTLPNYFKPIKLFCIENDVMLNWKKIARRIPRGRKFANDRAPTMEEIKKILAYPDRRIKPAVLVMLSCGGRVGLFDYLSYGNISPIIENGQVVAAKIRIYSGSDEEYSSFITPQAYWGIEEYISFRRDHGEKITPESPVLRDLFKPDHLGRGDVELPRRFGSDPVRHLVEDALKASGVRKKLEAGKRRYEFQPDHGFRKFFNTVCDKYMKTLYVEFLLGHDTGLKESYNRAQESELLKEYLKVIPELTVTFGGGQKIPKVSARHQRSREMMKRPPQ